MRWQLLNQLQTLLLANILNPRFKSVLIFSRNYVQVRRNYGRQTSNQLRGVRGASSYACSTSLSTGRRLMPMTVRCGAAALCRGAATVRQCADTRLVVGSCWLCGAHRTRATAVACENRGNPDRGTPSNNHSAKAPPPTHVLG